MIRAQRLYALQTVDVELTAKRQQLASLVAQLRDDSPLRAAQATLQTAEQQRHELQTRLKDLELRLGKLEAQIQTNQDKLYSGKGTPRELLNLQAEVNMLQRQRGTLETSELELMEELDQAEAAARQARDSLTALEARRRDEHQRLRAQGRELQAEVAALEQKRPRLVEAVQPADLQLYDRLRASKGGTPVARVERGLCLGCRLNLPTLDIARARSDERLVFCPSCGRIVFVQ